MPQKPIVIPETVIADRVVRNLITQWRNCHLRHRECSRRINWKNKKAAELEKKRRREKWTIVARVQAIEYDLLKMCADLTHHPDIWSSSKLSSTKESKIRILTRAYFESRRVARYLTGKQRALNLSRRKKIVAEIRAIERGWMLSIFYAIFPDLQAPAPLPLHPSDLKPRKLKNATKQLLQSLAA